MLNLFFRIKIQKYDDGVISLGTSYGFAFIPNKIFTSGSIIYSFGAGEDLHWEVEVVKKIKCKIFLFDPTPRSYDHFIEFSERTKAKEEYFSTLNLPYKANKEILDKIKFNKIALWNKDEFVKFFEPKNSNDVSHSITNIQLSENYIEVKAMRLSSIMKSLKHDSIDYLKLDIEGAEYEVIEDLLNGKLNVKFIYLECHYSNDLSPIENVRRVFRTINKIISTGYVIIHMKEKRYFTLMKKN